MLFNNINVYFLFFLFFIDDLKLIFFGLVAIS